MECKRFIKVEARRLGDGSVVHDTMTMVFISSADPRKLLPVRGFEFLHKYVMSWCVLWIKLVRVDASFQKTPLNSSSIIAIVNTTRNHVNCTMLSAVLESRNYLNAFLFFEYSIPYFTHILKVSSFKIKYFFLLRSFIILFSIF